ncbi:MAG: glycoside hydrolase family 43 protein [Planctomycetaceae bacterium]
MKITLMALFSVSFFMFIATAAGEAHAGQYVEGQFVNPIGEGADPWVVRDPDANRYLWCFSDGNRAIAVHTSNSLTSLGKKHIVWEAPASGPYSREVWAPELHWIQNRWYIYFAASDGQNRNHLAYVLRSKTKDPLGDYELHGPLATGAGPHGRSPNIWAIDMTPLEYKGKLFAIWSGWDEPDSDRQFLYIASMKSPVELTGPRVLLCANDEFPWEFTEENRQGRGLHEGPQVLKHNDRVFMTYSTAASWLPTYKLGMLELTGDDPLDPAAWKKFPEPAFQSTANTFGVGHSCFVTSPDRQEWWHVFHAKRDRGPGWQRAIFVQPMHFSSDGRPEFGDPVSANVMLPKPSGTASIAADLPISVSLKSTMALEAWNYYGHHQFIDFRKDGLHLGSPPNASPVNDYRSGEKIVLQATPPADLIAAVTINFQGNRKSRDAGLLFRATLPSVGYDAQRGYFVGLIPGTRLLVAGKTDGTNWTELARKSVDFDPAESQRLQVTCYRDSFVIHHNGEQVLSFIDATYPTGSVGVRVVDSYAIFTDFSLKPNDKP